MPIKRPKTHLYHANLTVEWTKLCNNILIGASNTVFHTQPSNQIAENTPSSSLSSALGSETQDDQTLEFPTSCTIPTINLLQTKFIPHTTENVENQLPLEHWTRNALRLHQSIQHMTALLRRQQLAYSHKYVLITSTCEEKEEDHKSDINEEERENEQAKLESSVASFVVSNVSQIESLRQSLNNENTSGSVPNSDELNFREGVLSYLLAELMTNVAEKFACMQSGRNRKSLELWKDPLRIMYPASYFNDTATNTVTNDSILTMDHSDDLTYCSKNMPVFTNEEKRGNEDEKFKEIFGVINEYGILETKNDATLLQDLNASLSSFKPKSMAEIFVTSHCDVDILANDPSSSTIERMKFRHKSEMIRSNMQKGLDEEKDHHRANISTASKGTSTKYANHHNDQWCDDTEPDHMEDLQRESVQLTASITNAKLDDVQEVESQMAQIMGLLSQFTSLIAEQQEEIEGLHDMTLKSVSNVISGNEHLIKAKARRRSNKHYFAKTFIVMAFILLFLNWMTP